MPLGTCYRFTCGRPAMGFALSLSDRVGELCFEARAGKEESVVLLSLPVNGRDI